MLEIQIILDHFQKDRSAFQRTNTLEFLIQALRGELEEFARDPSGQELADLIIYSLNIANALGLDAEEEVRTKIAFNHARFPSYEFQDGDYNEARLRCKKTEVIWKPVFYPTDSPSTENEK